MTTKTSIGNIVSLTQLCRDIPCSRPTALNYIALGMPYVTEANRANGVAWEFDLDECREWLADYANQKQAEHQQKIQEQEEDAGIVAARIRKLNIESDRLELRLATERGELVRIEDVADAVEDAFTNVRQHVLAIPSKVAPIVAGHTDTKEIERIISDYIHDALEALSEGHVIDAVTPEVKEDTITPPDKPHPIDVALGIENVPNGQ